jgi:signal transduction histidine kinase
MTLQDIMPKGENRKLEELATNLKDARVHYHYISNHVKKSGEVIDVEIKNCFVDFGGRETRLVIATDISERIRYLEAIKAQNIKLREVAWIQSHVVRTPLARIMGLIDLLHGYPHENKNATEILRHLSASAHELDGIIREIVSKAEQVEDQPILQEQPEKLV